MRHRCNQLSRPPESFQNRAGRALTNTCSHCTRKGAYRSTTYICYALQRPIIGSKRAGLHRSQGGPTSHTNENEDGATRSPTLRRERPARRRRAPRGRDRGYVRVVLGCGPLGGARLPNPSCPSPWQRLGGRRRPCAESAASTSSVCIRPCRSRCSTTTVVTTGSERRRRSLARDPFIAEPTSASTRTTRWPPWLPTRTVVPCGGRGLLARRGKTPGRRAQMLREVPWLPCCRGRRGWSSCSS